jgi:RNA polymerase sigma-70 factor (ECF subfamily)
MRFIEGFSLKEVADSLGKTEGAVKALQFRALSKLRGILKEEVHAQS